MQIQVEIVLQRVLGVPVWHPGFEGLSQASPEEDQEAGLLRRRPMSDFPEVPGVFLNAYVSWLDSVMVRLRGTEEKHTSGSKCMKAQFINNKKANRQKKKTEQKTQNRTGHHKTQRSDGVLESIDQSVQQYITHTCNLARQGGEWGENIRIVQMGNSWGCA